MASRRKKASATELSGSTDPRAALDSKALLDASKPLLKALALDLLQRADGSPALTSALQERHATEQKAQRTADGYQEWRRAFVEQVAAAWLLSCVFVRTLEDRGLLGKNRIAGPGALDSFKTFQQLAPSLSEREYLLTVFRELSRLPAAADLFDVRHNPVWLLAPSAEGARQLLELFRSPSVEAPAFRFGGEDTRFLGDLYQDLSEDVRKRYALLQTPRFVERFILDRTLEPAIERFGLDDTNLIDPTCGSGHFLLGAFERLFDHRLRKEPAMSAREAAEKALDAIAGSDINPYAIAVARFRLTLAFIEKCGLQRLRDVPRLPLHLAVADSLLYNPQLGQLALVEGTDPSKWEGDHFSLEDPKAARDVLFKQYAAVVGNPPYITPKDSTLRRRYADLYPSCRMNYALSVPFAERFFQLARSRGSVGMITANSFMKREFGKYLIESCLSKLNLELIVNASGAFIPGHGTPTVLLFGTHERPLAADVLVVLANSGEPNVPKNPEKGLVWSAIAEHWIDQGFENEHVSVVRIARDTIAKHPWSLGGGGATELKELLVERAAGQLADVILDIGYSVIIGEDDVFVRSEHATQILDVPSIPLVTGENVRDWGLSTPEHMLCPFDKTTLELVPVPGLLKLLWPWRRVLETRVVSGSQTMKEAGRAWFDVRRFSRDKQRALRSIAFAEVATHNHFALDGGEKVFKQTAPVIKLSESIAHDDCLALLSYLNSSVACFFLKQVCMNKGGSGVGRGVQDESWEARFQFDSTKVSQLPLPVGSSRDTVVAIARALVEFVRLRASCFGQPAVEKWRSSGDGARESLLSESSSALRGMCLLQEELDWIFYDTFGLLTEEQRGAHERARAVALPGFPFVSHETSLPTVGLAPGYRAFEILLKQSKLTGGRETAWFDRNAYEACDVAESPCSVRYQSLTNLRVSIIQSNEHIELLERPEHKRRWNVRDWHAEFSLACRALLLNEVEKALRSAARICSGRAMTSRCISDLGTGALAETALGSKSSKLDIDELQSQSLPFLAAYRYSSQGLETFATWERVWELQRREDRGERLEIAVPPRYGREDFASPAYWSLRGKLDVPKERFISYPGCESDEDKEPVYGWAGWDHLQRAVALAGLYQDRKQREGWDKERLKPMLAGLLELLPWLKQWHNEPSEELGGERPSDQFEAFLNAECSELGFTHDDLRAWRPAAKTRGTGKRKNKKPVPASESDTADSETSS